MNEYYQKSSKKRYTLLTNFLNGYEQNILTPQKLKRIREQEEFGKAHLLQFKSLTNREVEIIKLLVRGHNNPQVAQQLFISRNTVQQHRKNINRKLGIKSFTNLFQYALAFDLI